MRQVIGCIRTLLVVLVLQITWQTSADPGVVKTRKLADITWDSHLSAAIDLAERFLTASMLEDREHVGAILRDKAGHFWATHGIGGISQDTVTFSIPKTQSSEIVAFWHTHGRSGFARNLFSPDDVNIVRSHGVPLYLLAPNGDVKILRRDLLHPGSRSGIRRRSALGIPGRARNGVVVARHRKRL